LKKEEPPNNGKTPEKGIKENDRLTADKREIKDLPKLPLAISFIRKPIRRNDGI